MPDPSRAEAGDSLFSDFLKDRLADQEARKASFEQRGLSVVTTSGVLATLLFGVAAFAKTEEPYVLSHQAQSWLIVGLVAFVVAAVLALMTNLPLSYDVPSLESILKLAEADSPDARDAAQKRLARWYKRMATDAKAKNSAKGWLLFAALLSEVAAIIAVTVAVTNVVG